MVKSAFVGLTFMEVKMFILTYFNCQIKQLCCKELLMRVIIIVIIYASWPRFWPVSGSNADKKHFSGLDEMQIRTKIWRLWNLILLKWHA